MKTLFLSQSEVKKLISAAEANEAVENAFEAFGKGLAQMPPKSYLFYRPYKGDLRTMPAYIESLNATGVKIVNVHVNNAEKNLPTVMATIVLNDPETGYPIAIMDGTFLTALRTGSAGAIAIKYLARDDSNIIGFIGCGAQAYTQIDTSILIKKFKAFKAYDINEKRRNDFANYVKNKYGLELIGKNDIQDVCNADVVTTTTPVNTPIVKNEWIKEGTHINAIGADAPGKEELEPAILLRSKIVVDNWEQASHSGEINVPLEKGIITKDNIYAELGQIVAKIKQGRTSNKEITIFDSTGLAVQDIAVAKRVYDKAVKNNIGIQLELLK
jgi:alanine dehydrogenase